MIRPATERPTAKAALDCRAGQKHQWRYVGRADFGVEHERCDMPVWFACLGCDQRILSRCHSTAKQRCGPCGISYRHRVRRVFASGWTDRPTDRIVFITLTAPGDDLHGLPSGEVCACTPEGGINLATWNAMAGLMFTHFMLYLRRRYGNVEYARGAEVQKRGALHFHLLLRVEHLDRLLADYRPRDPHCPLRELAIARGFGHSIDVQLARPGHAGYCAKYASKTADDRAEMPWLDRRTGKPTTGNGRYRPWSASRRWGLTMAQVRAAQAAWTSQNGPASPEPSGVPQPALATAEAPEAPRRGAALDPNTHRYTTHPPGQIDRHPEMGTSADG